MKQKFFFTLVVAAAVATAATVCSAQPAARIDDRFDFDWKFTLADVPEAKNPAFDDAGWADVQLPHDWSIAQPFVENSWRLGSMAFLPGGVGWYRKTFEVPAEQEGKRIYIHFDGVYHRSDVYVNGKHAGFHPYGYTGFEYDVTPHIRFGKKNVIAVRVDHSDSPTSRWYSGSGIYRHVRLKMLNPVHISGWGTYVTTPRIEKKSADVAVRTSVENHSEQSRTVVLESEIRTSEGSVAAQVSSSVSLKGEGTEDVSQRLSVANPRLWSTDAPVLYTLVSTVRENGEIIDHYETPFGIRDIRFDSDKGFFLNGKPFKMKGMNLHQDAGSLGTAVPDRSLERRLQILKEYGCNAIRCSHNPPAPEFLDLCDRLGFLVIDEAFDKWKSGYYAQFFDEWWEKDLSAMLLRDRNHPSVVLWSIGNEVAEQNDTTQTGVRRLKMLQDFVHKTDPTRKVTMAIAPNDIKKRTYNATGFSDALDVVGCNYQEQFFADDHERYPSRIIFASEVFPYYRSSRERVREYEERNPWYDTGNNDFVFGYFVWAGVDYLGESSGWPSKGWPTCPFDVCMFERPMGTFLRAVWSEDKPVLNIAVVDQSLNLDPGKDHWTWPKIASHWTFPQYIGEVLHVQTITNCEEVELWVNQTSMGRRKLAGYSNNTISWRAFYVPGKITAKGYRNGVEVISCELSTAGKPAKIELIADRPVIAADGQDISHVTVRLLDEKGVVVPNDDRTVTFTVEGHGKLIGLDNADLRSNEPPKGNTRTTYFGKALAIIQSSRTKGAIRLTAQTDGLPEAVVVIAGE
jgi:beta-galactosidase